MITGASAGLGREFARQLAAGGNDLVLVSRRVEPMRELARDLESACNVAVDVIAADLANADAPAAVFAAVAERGLQIDCLINNAGSSGPDLIESNDWETSHGYLQLMTTSAVALCHFFAPAMRERGYGRILNVASVAGLVPTPGDYTYGPTKAYLIAFSRGLSGALRHDGIHVTALCPGFTHTDFHASPELARMKASLPKFIWYDAETVVREGLHALDKGRDIYISGRLYRYLVPVLRSPVGRLAVRVLAAKQDPRQAKRTGKT
ncbi:MAG: SDR family NAD(P)-dependent oxidoreductase [Gammaproteobacteria bacterium]|nr:SDR family NAD(P)-dependent oxidoreductase [Gammaproteobacteria bacterium]